MAKRDQFSFDAIDTKKDEHGQPILVTVGQPQREVLTLYQFRTTADAERAGFSWAGQRSQ